jgi:hypothetical protein
MNHGIADAAKIVQSVEAAVAGELSWLHAIDAYQQEMIARAGEEVALSLLNTEMLHDWDRAQDSPLLRKGGDKNEAK